MIRVKFLLKLVMVVATAVVIIAIFVLFFQYVLDKPLQQDFLKALAYGAFVAVGSFGLQEFLPNGGLKTEVRESPKSPPDKVRSYAYIEGRRES
jgi:hypothetical protein